MLCLPHPAPCTLQDERKAAAVKLLQGITVPRDDLYIPTNPDCRVLEIIPESAAPMQVGRVVLVDQGGGPGCTEGWSGGEMGDVEHLPASQPLRTNAPAPSASLIFMQTP